MKRIDLKQWCDFYQEICDIVLKEKSEAENERQKLRALFYTYYNSETLYDLKPMEYALVMLLAAATLNGGVCSKVASICQIFSERKLTFQVAVTILSSFLEEEDISWECLFETDSAFQHYFVTFTDNPTRNINSVISLQEQVIPSMQGRRVSVDRLSFCLEYAQTQGQAAVTGRQDEIDWLKEIYVRVILRGQDGIVQLMGDEGEGKKQTVACVAEYFYKGLLFLNGKNLVNMNMEDIQAALALAVRTVFFDGTVLYLDMDGVDSTSDTVKISMIFSILQRQVHHFIVGGNCQLNQWIHPSKPLYIREWKHASAIVQKQLWQQFMEEQSVIFDEDISLEELVSIYDLSPRNIEAVIKMCIPFAVREYDHRVITRQMLADSVKKTIIANFDQLVTKLETPFKWDDLKASEQTKGKMLSAIQRIKYRNVVNDQFGFGRKLPYGQGVVIALYGPSGTGKTMAATVIANELNLDIYRIDLSQISSKYIGESEKNLARIFDTAKNSNAILFFDEADSLFARRTSVGSSNDKYANAETGFLLQKMEEYRGLSILATNFLQNFDVAFRRRFTYIIPMERPTQKERLELWESIFPKEAPLAEDVHFDILARVADEMTGSEIKSAAISAAYAAAAQNRAITQRDIVEAVNEEYMKLGHTSILYDLMLG